MTICQKWFILVWMAAISTFGAVCMCLDVGDPDNTGAAFFFPIAVLVAWGLARWAERDL